MSNADPRTALLGLVARLPKTPKGRRSPVVIAILPLLADARIHPSVRIAATAGVLRVIPDRPKPVARVVRALTVGLSPRRALERMRQLQNRLARSVALDALIETRERRIMRSCPRCAVRLSRPEMIKHLWHEHGLTLQRGKTASPEVNLVELKDVFAKSGDVAVLDRLAETIRSEGLREWIAAEPAPEEVGPLLARAGEHGAGLCPRCFAEIPIPVPPLPPSLELTRGACREMDSP